MTNALGSYLKARRALLESSSSDPDKTGRSAAGSRVEEIARAAGISESYYRRLEQGRVAMPSASVIERLAAALDLDQSGTDYVLRLAGVRTFADPSLAPDGARDAMLRAALAPWSHAPAAIQTRNLDIVHVNDMLSDLTSGFVAPGENFVELFFSVDGARQTPDWEETAANNVAALRYYGDPADQRFKDLTGSLLVRDKDFRKFWMRHDAQPFNVGKSWHILDDIGMFQLNFRNLIIPGSGGHLLTMFTAEPGTPGDRALQQLRADRTERG